MNSFAATLHALMKEESWSQSELHRRSGVSQGLISGYLNDGALPEEDMLTKLVMAFDPEPGNALLVAWLRDRTPEELRDRVRIEPVGRAASRVMDAPVAPPGYGECPPKLRRLIDEIVTKIGSDPNFRVAIESTVRLTRPRG
jgi:transcriptional regulator with XRE-family HTH domain